MYNVPAREKESDVSSVRIHQLMYVVYGRQRAKLVEIL